MRDRILSLLKRSRGSNFRGQNESDNRIGAAPDVPSPEELQTPISPESVGQARASITDELLEESDRGLVELLNAVQQYIDNQEFVDRAGNAFVERLVEDINDRNSLRRLIHVGDEAVVVTIGAEGWAEITEALGMTDREAFAVRDAHHTYAEMMGLEAYVTQVNVLCLRMYSERLREFCESIEPEHSDVDLTATVA